MPSRALCGTFLKNVENFLIGGIKVWYIYFEPLEVAAMEPEREK